MSAPAHEAGMMSGRSTVLLVTVALHLLLISALMMSRAMPPPELDVPTIQSWVETEPATVVPERDTAVSPDRNWIPARIPIPEPDFRFEPEPEVGTLPAEPGVMPTGPGIRVDPTVFVPAPTPLEYRAIRPADDYYPPQSIRNNETGVVIVNACVSALGELSGSPVVANSSGHARLDAAAVTWVREALRFQPATHNGEPVAACKGFRVNFRLR